MDQESEIEHQDREIAPYPQESLLIEAIPEISAVRVICTSAGMAQFAGAAARALPHAQIDCTYLDRYRADLARVYWRESPPNLRIHCTTDLPEGETDVVALPFSARGEAELTRELVQAGHERLVINGRLYASTDNPNDIWLHEQMHRVFSRLERRAASSGVLYVGTKTEPLKKTKDFTCEFAFRDQGRLIRAISRPGVFSHRHIDTGARRLIDEMQIGVHQRVLDIGCGSGVVALAAACRPEQPHVHAVDSNARAVQCTERGAELNGLSNITTQLNADGNYLDAGSYDLALANPPYYAGFRIARHFLLAGRAALRLGGRILLVTKRLDLYRESLPEWYDDVTVTEQKGYYLIHGVKPSTSGSGN